jgi:hypothetical protein
MIYKLINISPRRKLHDHKVNNIEVSNWFRRFKGSIEMLYNYIAEIERMLKALIKSL